MDPAARAALSVALARLAAGDRGAQRPVFEGAWPAMRDFCKRLLGDATDADDAAQAAVIRLFEQASEYDSSRDGLSWALELSLWECRTVRRRRGRSHEEGLLPAALEVADGAPSPEADVSRRELEAALAVALAGLTEPDRAALAESLRHADANVAPATWRKRRERALNRLKLLWRSQHGA